MLFTHHAQSVMFITHVFSTLLIPGIFDSILFNVILKTSTSQHVGYVATTSTWHTTAAPEYCTRSSTDWQQLATNPQPQGKYPHF